MTGEELDQKMVALLNEAMEGGIHPVVLFAILNSKAYDTLMLIKRPQQPPEEPGPPDIIPIHRR